MSTATITPTQQHTRLNADRRFYLAMALASAAVIFTGFARSYYLKPHFPGQRDLSLLIHIHAAVFTAFILYFVLQTALIAAKKPALHRNLGLLGAALGISMIVLGLAVAFTAMRLNHGTPLLSPETTFLIGLMDISTFASFFLLGWVFRRNREAHQRLMLLAVIGGLLGAAIGRIVGYGVPIPLVSVVNIAFILAGPLHDLITRRRIHPVYVYGCLFLLLTFTPFRFPVGASPQWHRIAHAVVGR